MAFSRPSSIQPQRLDGWVGVTDMLFLTYPLQLPSARLGFRESGYVGIHVPMDCLVYNEWEEEEEEEEMGPRGLISW